MIPKINFRWSFIYQEEIHLPDSISYNDIDAEKYVKKFIAKLNKWWDNHGDQILRFMEDITGLQWKTNDVTCYVIKISKHGPISDPLTVPIQLVEDGEIFTLSLNRYIDMVVHELIHRLFVQNDKLLDEYFDFLIKKKYANKNWNVASHVPVHAIHKEIFLRFFNRRRLNVEIEACKYYPDYKQAWDIVNEEGSQQVLAEFRKFVNPNV